MNETTATKIRAALKLAGYSARKVTVREPHYGDVTVTIRDASVKISAVKAIAMPHRNVRYCEASGEILGGGNTYVEVKYLDTVLEALATEIEGRLLARAGYTVELAPGVVASADVEGYAGAARDAKVWKFEGNCGSYYCTGVRHGAERLAVELLDAGITALAPATVAA